MKRGGGWGNYREKKKCDLAVKPPEPRKKENVVKKGKAKEGRSEKKKQTIAEKVEPSPKKGGAICGKKDCSS